MFIFVYSDFESFFRTYFALVILLSSDFCFSLLYLYPTVLSEQKKRSRLRSGNAFGLFFALSFSLWQYRIILSADTASEVWQMLSQKRR